MTHLLAVTPIARGTEYTVWAVYPLGTPGLAERHPGTHWVAGPELRVGDVILLGPEVVVHASAERAAQWARGLAG